MNLFGNRNNNNTSFLNTVGNTTNNSFTTTTTNNNNNNTNGNQVGARNQHNDVSIGPCFNDTVSSLSFSPTTNLLVGTSWNNQVSCWDIQANGQAIPKAQQQHNGPILTSCFSADGENVFTGSADKTVKMWNLRANQQMQVGIHDAPIVGMGYIPDKQLLVTGSWDKTIRYWDCRSPNPAMRVQIQERVYYMACSSPVLVVATSNRGVLVYNLQNPQQPFSQGLSPLKFQTTALCILGKNCGYVIGSLEGRASIQLFEEKSNQKSFAFKTHRAEKPDSTGRIKCYPINSMALNPLGSFATAGGDGGYKFWTHEFRHRLHKTDSGGPPITCSTFNRDGTIYAYATGYDWSQGVSHYDRNKPTNIWLHSCTQKQVTPVPKKKTGY